ncbi:hypothetical protein [Novosphingobium sp. ZW T3_23]|uniref:hypothetical protein n=1 Tax=Novosphingobium sp. ZW T3_23 TaxID=3378084 RepID=UPI0038551CD4
MSYISTNTIQVVDVKEVSKPSFVKLLPRSGDSGLITGGDDPFLICLDGPNMGTAFSVGKLRSETALAVGDLDFEVDLTSGVNRSQKEVRVGCLRLTRDGVSIGSIVKTSYGFEELHYVRIDDSAASEDLGQKNDLDFTRWKIISTAGGERLELWSYEAFEYARD